MRQYKALAEAARLVEGQLSLIATLNEVKTLLMNEQSRFACRCRSCQSSAESTRQWLADFEATSQTRKVQFRVSRRRLTPINREP